MRHHHLDSLRAMLMLLGVVLHAALIFSTERNWLITSTNTHPLFDLIILIIHIFRMPAFFFLSGFLYALVLETSSITNIIKRIFFRIVVPLFAASILFNIPQIWLFDLYGPEYQGALIFDNPCIKGTFFNGCWVIHLWFLVTLIYFYSFCITMDWILTRNKIVASFMKRIRIHGPESHLWPLTILLFSVIGYLSQSLQWRGGIELLQWLPFLNPAHFFQYLPFFITGYLFQRNNNKISSVQSIKLFPIILIFISWVIILAAFYMNDSGRVQFLYWTSRYIVMLYYAVALQTTLIIFVVSKHLISADKSQSRHMTDASYTIYLSHHIIIFTLGLLTTTLNVPIFLKFLVVVTITLLVCYSIHHYIVLPSRSLRFLLNGRVR